MIWEMVSAKCSIEGRREYANPQHKHDLSKTLLEHILSYAMHVHLASMISCQILAFESLFTGLLSFYSCPWNPPLRIPHPWGPRPATKPRFIAKVQRRLEVVGDWIPINNWAIPCNSCHKVPSGWSHWSHLCLLKKPSCVCDRVFARRCLSDLSIHCDQKLGEQGCLDNALLSMLCQWFVYIVFTVIFSKWNGGN